MIKVQVLPNNVLATNDGTVANSVNFETVNFSFPKTWKDYTKTVIFKHKELDVTVKVVLDDLNPLCIDQNTCIIPFEVLKAPGMYISVFGNKGESVATSTEAYVVIAESGDKDGNEPLSPTPDQYAQLISLATETKAIAQSVRNDADNGLFKGDKGDKGDTGDIDTSLFANAIQNTVSGNVISVKDVNTLEHTVKVQLSVNDEENLFDTPAPLTDSEAIEYHESVAIRTKIDLKDYTTYTIQFECNKVGIGMHHHPLLTDGNQGGVTTTGEVQTVTFTTGRLSGEYPQQFLYADGFWEILCYDASVPADIKFTNLAIAEGTTITGGENATDFTKVKLYRYGLTSNDNKITLTPNADGTVDVPSLSPYMTLETDKGNVTITATYNLDTKGYIDKKFEDFVNVAEVGV